MSTKERKNQALLGSAPRSQCFGFCVSASVRVLVLQLVLLKQQSRSRDENPAQVEQSPLSGQKQCLRSEIVDFLVHKLRLLL